MRKQYVNEREPDAEMVNNLLEHMQQVNYELTMGFVRAWDNGYKQEHHRLLLLGSALDEAREIICKAFHIALDK